MKDGDVIIGMASSGVHSMVSLFVRFSKWMQKH